MHRMDRIKAESKKNGKKQTEDPGIMEKQDKTGKPESGTTTGKNQTDRSKPWNMDIQDRQDKSRKTSNGEETSRRTRIRQHRLESLTGFAGFCRFSSCVSCPSM